MSLSGSLKGPLHSFHSDSACAGDSATDSWLAGVSKEDIMRRTGWIATAAAIVAVVSGGARLMGANGQDNGERGPHKPCSLATLHGDYGVQFHGTRPLAPPPNGPGGIETVIGIVLRTYDGEGNTSQIENAHGSITGTLPDQPGFGTYEVNPDCTGSMRFEPRPGVVIEDRFVIVDDGREIRSAVMTPLPAMVTAVARRIHVR